MVVAYRWGRLYCGWLCPHFSVVELLNNLLHRACGKLSLWDTSPTPRSGVIAPKTLLAHFLPQLRADGLFVGHYPVDLHAAARRHLGQSGACLSLTANQARFIGVGTLVFTLEFTLARHLFCRFGCAVGYFQSVAWMANPQRHGGGV